jgi:hypothetical protein
MVRVQQRTWVGLTDAEVEGYWDWEDFQTGAGRLTIFEMVRDIEAKLREKNTHPPQRTWVGLTKDELMSIFDTAVVQFEGWAYERAIEAKLKQKNGFAEDKNT